MQQAAIGVFHKPAKSPNAARHRNDGDLGPAELGGLRRRRYSSLMNQAISHVKTLGQKDIVLFTVSAILLLDTLAAGATVGASSVFWWLFLGVVFFVPYALICAEMGTTYPEQGGLYAWVRDAFGRRWAAAQPGPTG